MATVSPMKWAKALEDLEQGKFISSDGNVAVCWDSLERIKGYNRFFDCSVSAETKTYMVKT